MSQEMINIHEARGIMYKDLLERAGWDVIGDFEVPDGDEFTEVLINPRKYEGNYDSAALAERIRSAFPEIEMRDEETYIHFGHIAVDGLYIRKPEETYGDDLLRPQGSIVYEGQFGLFGQQALDVVINYGHELRAGV